MVVVIINFDFTFNAIAVLMGLLAWSVIGYFANRINQKQMKKPKVWKILIVLLIGLFSFSIKWNMFGEMIKIPILPLGMLILYFVFRGKRERWETYRSYAWLGFLANFIFLLSTLVAVPIHHAFYQENELSTYISTVENASINPIHPSAENFILNNEKLSEQLHEMKQETIYSDQWYEETYMYADSTNRKERFPYQLIGTAPKWGSGFQTIIYLEEDGKGILLSTSKKQLYFRSEISLIEEGE